MKMTNDITVVSRRRNIVEFVQCSLLIFLMTGCAFFPSPINGKPPASPTTVTPRSTSPTIPVCCSPTPSSTSSLSPTPSPGTILLTANWSSGLNGWGPPDGVIGRSVWSTRNGMLVCDGSEGGGLSGPLLLLGRHEPARNLRPQAARPGRGPRRLPAHPHRRSRHPRRRGHGPIGKMAGRSLSICSLHP